MFQQFFFLFSPPDYVIFINRINYSIIILCFEWKSGKFENVRIFKHYKILIVSSKKEGNHYDLNEMENMKNAKIVWIVWRHNILTEIFTITEKSAFCTKKSNFWPAATQVANFLPISTTWYNLKRHGRLLFFLMYSSLDIGKVKNICLLHTYFYVGVVFSCIQAF